MGLPYVNRRVALAELGLAGALVLTPPYWTDVEATTMLEGAASTLSRELLDILPQTRAADVGPDLRFGP